MSGALIQRDVRSQRDVIVRQTIALIARAGIRGATMRDIAAECGVSASSISTLFGNKDGLIAECFRTLAADDADWLDARLSEAERFGIGATLTAPLLWSLVEDAWGERRLDMLALIELWLAAPGQSELSALCRGWIAARRDRLRQFAAASGEAPMILDMLGLHVLSESCFAVSCGGSAAYRLIARAGFLEAAALLAGGHEVDGAFDDVARAFYADPPATAAGPREGQQKRAQDSRDRMINAAASIIEEDGLASVTNRAVAERAGVSLALTTYHFKLVSELAFAGILRVFERVNASLAQRPAETSHGDQASGRRLHPTGVERLRSRGMAEISLAAARGAAPAMLGLDMRRQRGTLTHAAARQQRGEAAVSRTRAASHALWSSAAFLVAAVTPAAGEHSDDSSADALFDFDAQARRAATALLAAD